MKKLITLGLSAIVVSLCVLTFSGCGEEKTPYERLQEAKEKQLGQAPGEIFAAISMAMHEFQNDVHDVEDTILTITRVKRSYSPWSSKIYTLRETPHKK